MNLPDVDNVYGLLYLPTGAYIHKSYGRAWLENLLRANDKQVPWARTWMFHHVPGNVTYGETQNYNFEIVHLPYAKSVNDGGKSHD